MKKKTIVVAGHICLDITPTFVNQELSCLENVLVPGHLVQMGTADVHVGGVVGNTGLALKFLGADVRLMGMVGQDAFGGIVLSQLETAQAKEGMLISKTQDTSYSVVIAPRGIDRIFLHHSGANDEFYAKDLNYKVIENAALFHFGYPPLMRRMYENDGNELVNLFKKIKSLGVATSLDLSSVDEHSFVGRIDWSGILKRVLPYVDFFVPSIEELVYMTDPERYHTWAEEAGSGDFIAGLNVEADIKPAAQKARSFGAKIVMVKCGALGLYLHTAASGLQEIGGGVLDNYKEWEGLHVFEKSYRPEKVLSAAGAGDTSIAAFLYAVTKGYHPKRCLRLAAAEGAACVEAYDALSGLKKFEELERKIADGWEKS